MEVFYKKDSLIRTICFMAFFVAINVVCSFVAVYAPLVSIILIIILPLTSAVVEINCKDRWFPIYAIATLGLSIVASLSAIDFTLFYLVPSIVTGYIFGLMAKKGFPNLWGIFIAAVPLLSDTILIFLFTFAFLFEGINGIFGAISLKNQGVSGWGWTLALAIITVILGFLLVGHPLVAALSIDIIVAAAMLCFGITMIVLSIQMSKAKATTDKMNELNG